jgi:hypothetical protein
MPNNNIKIGSGDRSDVIHFINEQRKLGPFTVVDVGGSVGGWSSSVVDAIIDFNDPIKSDVRYLHFKCDITHPDSWNDIVEHVKINGKYDFCICTHTLEDIMNPAFVCEQICKIAKSGYIAVPSKYRELSRFELGANSYRGYIHHRWIFDIVDNTFIGYPKINLVEYPMFDSISDISISRQDLSFYWKDTIDIKYVNNNYLGPNVQAVIDYYNRLLID